MSTLQIKNRGNGKIDNTPSPVGLRKINRISFKVFLSLKELLNNFKPRFEKKIRRYRKICETANKPVPAQVPYAQSYEPTNMADAYNSLFWQWRRVSEWYRYVNDPLDYINGHMTT